MQFVKILSTSKDKKHLSQTSAFLDNISQADKNLELETTPYFLSDNKDGLPNVYNSFLDFCRTKYDENTKETDWAIMIHSDVMFQYSDIISHCLKVSDKYDIIGLAGTKKIDLSISPLTWFTGSRNFTDKRYGRVIHKQFNLGESFFNGQSFPNVKDTEVSAIDGLCIILNKRALNSGIRFDERFLFDFYDLDFCLTALTKNHLRIGVIVEPVIHESVGTSILRPEYLIEEKKFREKWNVNNLL